MRIRAREGPDRRRAIHFQMGCDSMRRSEWIHLSLKTSFVTDPVTHVWLFSIYTSLCCLVSLTMQCKHLHLITFMSTCCRCLSAINRLNYVCTHNEMLFSNREERQQKAAT